MIDMLAEKLAKMTLMMNNEDLKNWIDNFYKPTIEKTFKLL